jgi:exodeoxyribonuclease III
VSLRLLSYNIRHGGVGREQPITEVIKACQPDVVILQEAVNPDLVKRLAALCGLAHSGALPEHSVGYLSRVEVTAARWHRVPFARRHYLELNLAAPGYPRIYGVHLAAIHSNVTERRRMYEITSVMSAIAAGERGFHLIVGDFNTLGPGESLDLRKLPLRLRALAWVTGRKIRWRTIQLMLDRGYIDVYRRLHPSGEAFTFPTWDPHVRLDYLFTPTEHAPRVTACDVMREIPQVRAASDHFPLLSVIEVPA